MNERRQDFELLQRFTRHGEQLAFADVVRRHLDGEGLSERAGSQLWAAGCNPFGIAFNGIPDLRVMIRTLSGGPAD